MLHHTTVGVLLIFSSSFSTLQMIPPRGCAYIVMIHRQDAYRALQKLSRGSHKVNQKAIKVSEPPDAFSLNKGEQSRNANVREFPSQIAWALNKGIKADFKQYWDVELGVTYIPWSKVKESQLEELREGGILDVDTLSPGRGRMHAWCTNIKSFPPHLGH